MSGGTHAGKPGTGGRTLFTLEIEGAGLRARKKTAPAARPHADKRRAPSRRRPDYFADIAD